MVAAEVWPSGAAAIWLPSLSHWRQMFWHWRYQANLMSAGKGGRGAGGQDAGGVLGGVKPKAAV